MKLGDQCTSQVDFPKNQWVLTHLESNGITPIKANGTKSRDWDIPRLQMWKPQ